MGYFNKINGNKVYLSPIKVDDYEIYLEWMNRQDRESKIVFESFGHVNSYIARKEYEYLPKRNGYAIVSKENNKIIGLIYNCDILNQENSAKIAIKMDTNLDYDKQVSFGAEALNIYMGYCFNYIGYNSVLVTVPVFNKQLMDICNKSKLKYVGNREGSSHLENNDYYDTSYYYCNENMYLRNLPGIRHGTCKNPTILDDLKQDLFLIRKELVGNRVCLSKYDDNEKDIDTLQSFLCNPEVSIPFGEYKNNYTREQLKEKLENVSYLIKTDDKLIGIVNLYNENFINRTADLSVLIGDTSYQNKGIAKEVIELVLKENYENDGANNIKVMTLIENARTLNMLKGLGFEKFATLGGYYYTAGKSKGVKMLQMTKEIYSRENGNR